MAIDLAYGRGFMGLEIPDGVTATVIRKAHVPVPADPNAVIAEALANPVAAEPLVTAATGAKTACILICDFTRPVPNRLFLRPLIDRLTDAGVPMIAPTWVVSARLPGGGWSIALATPKSMTFAIGRPSTVATSTLLGFRSRWITPRWWACCTASHASRNSSRIASTAGACAAHQAVIGGPSISSIANHGRPSGVVPASWISAMCG